MIRTRSAAVERIEKSCLEHVSLEITGVSGDVSLCRRSHI
jgi:hypothetical protein